MASFLTNIYLWITLTMVFLAFFIGLLIFLIILAKKTHAIIEFKAWTKGYPICLFFQENRYCDWKPVNPVAGIIEDADYGSFIINERATYVDKRTKNVLIAFDSNFGASVNVHAAKLADDLQYAMKDEKEMKVLRHAISNNLIDDSESIEALKTSVNFGAIKNMMTALIPHHISAKIEKIIAARMKGYGKVNIPQVLLIFAGMLGAILLGAMIIKLAFNK
jgi:hypothetical protein